MKRTEPGINWIWYMADTMEEAIEYYIEIHGTAPKYDWEITNMAHEGEPDKFGFRVHR